MALTMRPREGACAIEPPALGNGHHRLSAGAQALLELLRLSWGRAVPAGSRAAAGGMDWDEVLRLALACGVAPLLQRALQASGALADCPEDVRSRLAQARRTTAFKNLRVYREFQRLAQALHARGIPVIALKGLHLADLVYGDISLRPMSDLDILVSRTQVGQAVAVLQSLGYGVGEDAAGAAGAMPDSTKCNLGLANPGAGTWLEVHWALGEPAERYCALTDEVWRNTVAARFDDAEALVMSPELLLLHVCVHLACGHVFLFSAHGLCDIAEIVRAYPSLDWRKLAQLSARYGLARGVAAALRLARDHLGAAIPDAALAALGGDALDPDLLADALAHLFDHADMPHGLQIAPNILALAGSGTRRAKLATVWHRIFVPRAELALLYGVPRNSLRAPFYYAARLRDLLRRYAAGAWALKVSDPLLSASAARHVRLEKWLRDDDGRADANQRQISGTRHCVPPST